MSPWKGKMLLSINMGVVAQSALQSIYFPCELKKLFIGTALCIMKHKRARDLGLRASSTVICVYISPFPLLHHTA